MNEEKRDSKRKYMQKYWIDRNKKRYHADKKYRQRVLDKHDKWRKKRDALNKLGDPDKIKELCKQYGFSDGVCEAIAVDGIVLDKKLKERFGD